MTYNFAWEQLDCKQEKCAISKQPQAISIIENSTDENENAFREVLCNDDDPIDELELAPAKLNTNEFVNTDADIATNNLQPMTVEEKVNCLNNETHPESDDTSNETEENRTTVTPPTQEELHGTLETLTSS